MILSVCIVNWNTREFLRECLRSLARYPLSWGETETTVVDNASADGSREMVEAEFPEVELIANDCNRGYAAANNQALRVATGKYALLLNPDTVMMADTLDVLIECAENHPEAGAIGCKLLNPDGSHQLSCRSFPTPAALLFDALKMSRILPRNPIASQYRMSYWNYDTFREVDQPAGSALLLKREALDQVGLMDERFDIFFNDVDLCYRLKQAGWKIYFCPQARLIHHLGASTSQVKKKMILKSGEAMARFYRKHYQGWLGWPVFWLMLAGIKLGTWVRLIWHRVSR